MTGALADSPAARDRLPRVAEEVLAVDGRAVGTTLAGYCAAVGRVRSWDSVVVTVTRGGGRGQRRIVVQAA